MTTKVLTAHVPLPLVERVDQLAARLERPRGWIVKQALMAWIDQEEERRQLTLDALADVDAGHVIDHQAVQVWADRLSTNKPLPLSLLVSRSMNRAARVPGSPLA
ncbi:MAG TPA: ribbon-helix-helix domain-containing protein [Gemmatimonadaceae bacterium]|jgi:predicted transcriptional regulator|nr:ribbon-helix-helix domain-containing protein [Gemmatimonadaceae bacterium]